MTAVSPGLVLAIAAFMLAFGFFLGRMFYGPRAWLLPVVQADRDQFMRVARERGAMLDEAKAILADLAATARAATPIPRVSMAPETIAENSPPYLADCDFDS